MKKHKILLLDDYNGKVYMNPNKVFGCVTTQFGDIAPRHGWKIIVVYGKTKKRTKKCVQLFNIFPYTYSNNSQRGRIYSSAGLSPAIGTFQGGGLEPKIIKVNGLWL